MANDPPTTLRMGFGFPQARAAGAPYQAPPTTKQMDFHVRERAAEKEIRALVESNPSIGPRVRQIIEEHASKCPTQDILFVVKCLIAAQSKTGFTVTGADGKSYKSNKIKCIDLHSVSIIYEGRPFTLWRHYIKSITANPPP